MYDIYKQARDAAWQFLIDNGVKSLPIKLSEICKNNGIGLFRDTDLMYLSESDRGATYFRDNQFRIFVNGHDPIPVQRYTIAHELGHVFLQHPMTDEKYGRSYGIQREPKSDIEYQAERFAIDILAPACVLWGLNLHTADEISEACGISTVAAGYRAERMKVLYQRNAFLKHPLEQQVFEKFKEFMKNAQ